MDAISGYATPIRRIAGIAFPHLGREDESSAAAVFRWCLHGLFWTSLLAVLWYLNRWGGLERSLRSAWPAVHAVWLPLLVVPIYVLGWLGVGLWAALKPDPINAFWPDLDSAWNAARRSLGAAKVDAVRTPLFLILGPMPREFEVGLTSLGASPHVLPGDAPFRLFASAQAIYLVCDRLGRLGADQGSSLTPDGAASDAVVQSRLQHLGQMLQRDRTPRLPVQGIVVTVSASAARTDRETRGTLLKCREDLRDLRLATGFEVPLYLGVNGLDRMPGGSAQQNQGAWTLRFPPLPDLDPAEIVSMYKNGIESLILGRMPCAAYTQFELDGESGDVTSALANNVRLYQWLSDLHALRGRLERLLLDGTGHAAAEPGMVAGCYLLTSGMSDAKATELSRALLKDLHSNREMATWTADAADRAAAGRNRAWILFVIGVAALVGSASLGAVLAWRS